jgi:subtilase family serine protease
VPGPKVMAGPTGLGPSQIQSAYRLSGLSSGGRTVAIVDAYDDPKAESDLATFRKTYGLSACTTANGCFKKVNTSGP